MLHMRQSVKIVLAVPRSKLLLHVHFSRCTMYQLHIQEYPPRKAKVFHVGEASGMASVARSWTSPESADISSVQEPT